MPTTSGHQAVIRYIEETTPGTTPTNPALLLFSPEVQNIKWGIDPNLKESRDIGSLDIHDLYSVMNSYSCSVDFDVYDMARVGDLFTRKSDGTVRVYTLEVIPNRDAGAGVVVYFRGNGWKPNSVNLKGTAETAYTISVTFEGGKWSAPTTTDPGIGTGSRELPAAITETIKHFASGAIALNGTPWAVLLGTLDLTVDHGVKVHRNTGDKDPAVAVAASGPRTIKGACDISMDAGFKTSWDRVTAGASHTLTIPFGTTGAPLLTITGVRMSKLDVEVKVDDDLLMGQQPFIATGLTMGTVP